MTPQEIDALKAERDALLQELHKANSIIIDLQRNPPKFTAEYLCDVQAEAGRAGFVAGASKWIAAVHPIYAEDAIPDIEADADRYAAKVQQGGAE